MGDDAAGASPSEDIAEGDTADPAAERVLDLAETGDSVFKIDDLARLTGITVDTIRFYQREGLLPGASRQGRSITYSAAHVHALNRIKDLQEKHFSLRAIKSLAEEGRLGLVEILFSPVESREEAEGSLLAPGDGGIDADLVRDLLGVGLVTELDAEGRVRSEELAPVRATQELIARGLPRSLVLLLVELFVQKFSELEKEIAAAVAGQYRSALAVELNQLAEQDPAVLATVLPVAEVIFHHVQGRSLQRIAQEAIESLVEGGDL